MKRTLNTKCPSYSQSFLYVKKEKHPFKKIEKTSLFMKLETIILIRCLHNSQRNLYVILICINKWNDLPPIRIYNIIKSCWLQGSHLKKITSFIIHMCLLCVCHIMRGIYFNNNYFVIWNDFQYFFWGPFHLHLRDIIFGCFLQHTLRWKVH